VPLPVAEIENIIIISMQSHIMHARVIIKGPAPQAKPTEASKSCPWLATIKTLG